MTKEKFLKIYNLMKKQDDYNSKFNRLLDDINGTVASTCQLDKWTMEAINMLFEEIFTSESIDIIHDWIWPLYEHNEKNPMKFKINGKEVLITTIEELYDKFLTFEVKK